MVWKTCTTKYVHLPKIEILGNKAMCKPVATTSWWCIFIDTTVNENE